MDKIKELERYLEDFYPDNDSIKMVAFLIKEAILELHQKIDDNNAYLICNQRRF